MRLRSPATLRALMEQYGFSLGRLARYADCSKGFISHLLSGRRSSCTPELAARIAEALNVPLEVIFDANVSPTGMSSDKHKREKVPA
ncbi:hypothetical protein A9W98_17840 [Mycobacterium gordonae]|uniref:HTH cro/C1-type domain-containing protein n=1 Tax=Mycobacterium gordonae TaxID=1778 RepID=A0A1A6BHM1_MYCGO|nr:helix-turn-helix transcriptional regulator [Mycobacterium gordonae]OBS01847.1 hypothetical protein A9W98_17840 [Mycobacterium gordonae]